MLDSVSIRNFKRIGDDGLTLNNLAQVNYLVGENGCGKSSVLEALVNFKFSDTNANKISNNTLFLPFHESTEVQIYEKDTGLFTGFKKNKFYGDFFDSFSQTNYHAFYISPNDTSLSKDLLLQQKNTFWQNLNSINQLINVSDRSYLKSKLICSNPTFSLLGKELLSTNQITTELLDRLNYIGRYFQYVFQIKNNSLCLNDREVKFEFLAGGFRLLLTIEWFVRRLTLNRQSVVIYLNEPEHSLHPSLQKQLPNILDKLIQERVKQNTDISFFVSTHSPFIISAAAAFQETQKVYLIKDGQTVDLTGEATARGANGFSAGECLLAANTMLGVGLEDLIPSLVIICESSLKVLLQNYLASKNIAKSIQIIDHGDSDDTSIQSRGNFFNTLVKLFANQTKANVFNFDVLAIIDNCAEIHHKIVTWKSEYSNLIVIPKEELEQTYPLEIVNEFLIKDGYSVWDGQGKFKNYLKANSLTNDIKNELAKYVGNHKDFKLESTLPEIYFRIFAPHS